MTSTKCTINCPTIQPSVLTSIEQECLQKLCNINLMMWMLLCITVQYKCKCPTKCQPKLKWLGTCRILNEMFRVILSHNLSHYIVTFKIIKAISLQAWTGSNSPRICRQLAHEGGNVVSPMHWLPLPSPPKEIHLIFIVVRACTDLSILSQRNSIT